MWAREEELIKYQCFPSRWKIKWRTGASQTGSWIEGALRHGFPRSGDFDSRPAL